MSDTLRQTLALLLLAAVAVCGLATAGPAAADDERRAAAWRTRRVIFNNDGNDAFLTSAPATKEGFWSVRMDHIDDCGVDSVFYNPCQGIGFGTLETRVGDVFTSTDGSFQHNRTAALIAQGTDPLHLAAEACRRRDIEFVWSLRLNDIHDSFQPVLFTRWKQEHAQLLMGTREDLKKYPSSDPRHVWSFADFAHQEVRDMVVANVKDVVNRYNVDGAELDFLRHTCFFKETRLYQPATREHTDMLTDMVGQVRREILAASAKKGSPILLCVRVLPGLELNRRFGFDVERWIERGYIDVLVVGGGYDPFTLPVKQMIDVGHAADIPVYACLSLSGMQTNVVKNTHLTPQNIKAWRGAAANAWHAGVDGITSFNVFPQSPGTEQTRWARAVWQNLNDPTALVGKDKMYCIENLGFSYTSGYMMRSVPWKDRLPADVSSGATIERVLPVAEDLAGVADTLDSLRLRVAFLELQADDRITVKINGTPIKVVAEKPNWVAGDVSPDVLKKGGNVLSFTYQSGAAPALTVALVELHVNYKADRSE